MRPCLNLTFRLLRILTGDAIDAAKAAHAAGQLDAAVNWADLRVVNVEYYEDDSGATGWRVYVEEASPGAKELADFIRLYLQERHIHALDVQVVTEW